MATDPYNYSSSEPEPWFPSLGTVGVGSSMGCLIGSLIGPLGQTLLVHAHFPSAAQRQLLHGPLISPGLQSVLYRGCKSVSLYQMC